MAQPVFLKIFLGFVRFNSPQLLFESFFSYLEYQPRATRKLLNYFSNNPCNIGINKGF